jgi:hypothetical protein
LSDVVGETISRLDSEKRVVDGQTWVTFGLRRLPSVSSVFGGNAEVDFRRLKDRC